MREVLGELLVWWRDGHTVGMGTVVSTFHSAPMPAGSSMVVGPEGEAVGSVSGGCVEGAVYELAQSARETGEPVLERYGVSTDTALSVGLTCGGMLDVFVERIDRESFPDLEVVARDVEEGRPVAVATVIEHPDPLCRGGHLVVRPGETSLGGLGGAGLEAAVAADALGLLNQGQHGDLTYGVDGELLGTGVRVFVWSFAPAPRMLVFGAIDFAVALARMGSYLGYHVTVCDARPVFATARRFPSADKVVVDWPHRYLRQEAEAGLINSRTVVCVLTHDPKFDVPLLETALALPVGYVGAMGSRRTHDDRLARLREAGVTEGQLERLCSPIGLDLGARTPEGTAVSIAAEIIAQRGGGSGQRLSETVGRIHHSRSAVSP